MLSDIQSPPIDPILSLSAAFRDDQRRAKVDLGIGVYKDEKGQTPIMAAVKKSHQIQLTEQQTKAYVGLAGNEVFNQSIIDLLLSGTDAHARVSAVQTPGASGALRMLGDLIKHATPNAKVWLSNPSYINHEPVMRAAGLDVGFYQYFDRTNYQVDGAAMLASLAQVKAGDIVLLHGCCHNPTGADMPFELWQEVTELAQKVGFIPFVDIAYQGFGEGLAQDALGLRYMAENLEEMLIAQSCSKNFGLYRERTGAAIVIGKSLAQSQKARQKLLHLGRATYTMPPDHGADLVARILQDQSLTQEWQEELSEMQQRLAHTRQALCAALNAQQTDSFDYIQTHKGMFSLLKFTPAQMRQLRDEFAIYAVEDGRINLAGLQAKDIEYVANAIAKIEQV